MCIRDSYTGVHCRPAPEGSGWSAEVITQLLYLSQTVVVRGGYTTANGFAEPPDPLAYPTVLDAEGQGRVVFITGTVTVTLESLDITGGNAAGLGSDEFGGDAGGGVYAATASLTITGARIYSNTTGGARGFGGGFYVIHCGRFDLLNSAVYSNAATGDYGFAGGGFAKCAGEVAVSGNTISGNRGEEGVEGAGAGGGGLVAGSQTRAIIHQNVIAGNEAAGPCGGLTVGGMGVTATAVSGNVISGNHAGYSGGGLCLWWKSYDVLIRDNVILRNRASVGFQRQGGGIFIDEGANVTLTNNVIAGNELVSGGQGAGVYVGCGQCSLIHNTIASNGGGDGSGLYVDALGGVVALTNTILVDHDNHWC